MLCSIHCQVVLPCWSGGGRQAAQGRTSSSTVSHLAVERIAASLLQLPRPRRLCWPCRVLLLLLLLNPAQEPLKVLLDLVLQ